MTSLIRTNAGAKINNADFGTFKHVLLAGCIRNCMANDDMLHRPLWQKHHHCSFVILAQSDHLPAQCYLVLSPHGQYASCGSYTGWMDWRTGNPTIPRVWPIGWEFGVKTFSYGVVRIATTTFRQWLGSGEITDRNFCWNYMPQNPHFCAWFCSKYLIMRMKILLVHSLSFIWTSWGYLPYLVPPQR